MEKRMGGSTIGHSTGTLQDGIGLQVGKRMHPSIRPELEQTILANESFHELNAKQERSVAERAWMMSAIHASTPPSIFDVGCKLSCLRCTRFLDASVLAPNIDTLHESVFDPAVDPSSKGREGEKKKFKHSFLVVLG